MKIFGVYFLIDSYKKDGELDSFGQIHIKLNDYAFPSEVWTDFGLYIISAWAESFCQLHEGKIEKAQCKFMDGNYRFDVSVKSENLWAFQFVAQRKPDEVWEQGEVDPAQATKELLTVIDVVISEHNKSGQDVKVNFWNSVKQKLANSQKQKSLVYQ